MQNQNYPQSLSKNIQICKNTLTGIVEAEKSKKVAECSDAELAQKMILIYFTIGLRSSAYPTKEMEAFLFKYIRENFGHRHIDEIYLAFDLAIKEQLDIDDIRCYDNFSIEYFQRIMNSYRRYRNKAIKETKTEAPKELIYQMTKEDKLQEIERYKAMKEISVDFLPTYLYDYMIEFEMIQPGIEGYVFKACQIHKQTLFLQADKGDLSDKKRYSNFCRMIESGEVVYPEKALILSLIKRIKVFDYLKSKQ